MVELSPQSSANITSNLFETYNSARVVVLGAAGFIGRWVTHYLAATHCELHLVVRDCFTKLKPFESHQINAKIWTIDLTDFPAAHDLLAQLCPSIVFNLAGYGVDRSETDELSAYQINAHLVEAIASVLVRNNDPDWPGMNLVHVGSALEYGNVGGDFSETTQPNPTTLYGRSKLEGTKVVAHLGSTSGLKGVTARLFTVYGPGEHPGRLLPSLLAVAKSRESIPLTSGRQKRDFTFVKDVADGLLRIGLSQAKPGEVVNLATGTLTQVYEFVGMAARILNINPNLLLFGDLATRESEMNHSPVNISRLRQLVSWSPPTQIEEGIRQTVDSLNMREEVSTI